MARRNAKRRFGRLLIRGVLDDVKMFAEKRHNMTLIEHQIQVEALNETINELREQIERDACRCW